jgi:hypothetical protein
MNTFRKTETLWAQYINTNYWVSTQGEVVEWADGQLPKQVSFYKAGAGYRVLYCKGSKLYIHRMVMVAFDLMAADERKMQVNHIDGDKSNNRLTNLELIAASDNIKHAYKSGLIKPRNTHSDASNRPSFFTDEDVRQMRQLFADGFTQVQIASLFGTIQPTISRIVRNVYRSEVV